MKKMALNYLTKENHISGPRRFIAPTNNPQKQYKVDDLVIYADRGEITSLTIGYGNKYFIAPKSNIFFYIGDVSFKNYHDNKRGNAYDSKGQSLLLRLNTLTLIPAGNKIYENGFITQTCPIFEIKEIPGLKYVDRYKPKEVFQESTRQQVIDLVTQKLELLRRARELETPFKEINEKIKELDPLGRVQQEHRQMLREIGIDIDENSVYIG